MVHSGWTHGSSMGMISPFSWPLFNTMGISVMLPEFVFI